MLIIFYVTLKLAAYSSLHQAESITRCQLGVFCAECLY
jgi:hypothetical protein